MSSVPTRVTRNMKTPDDPRVHIAMRSYINTFVDTASYVWPACNRKDLYIEKSRYVRWTDEHATCLACLAR